MPQPSAEQRASAGLMCGRQRPRYRDRDECGRCPTRTWQVINGEPTEEDALRTGYDWWLWVSGGERDREQNTRDPYLSTDPALYNDTPPSAATIAGNGYIAAVGTGDGYIRAFNAKTGSMISSWRLRRGEDGSTITSLQMFVHSQGAGVDQESFYFVAVADADGAASIHTTNDPDAYCTLIRQGGSSVLHGDGNTYTDIAFYAEDDGDNGLASFTAVTVGDGDGRVRVYDGPAWTVENSFNEKDSEAREIGDYLEQPDDEKFTCVSMAQTAGNFIAAGTRSGIIYLWDHAAGGGAPVQVLTVTENQPIVSVHVADDGQTVAAGDEEGTVLVWSTVMPYNELMRFTYASAVRGVQFTPDGGTLAVTTADGNLFTRTQVTANRGAANYTPEHGPIRLQHPALPRTLAIGDLQTTPLAHSAVWPHRQPAQYRLIVGHEGEQSAGLWDWSTANAPRETFRTFDEGEDEDENEERERSENLSWFGHTSLPVQFRQGAEPFEVHQPLPGLPQPSPSLEARTNVTNWQEQLFRDMRVGRVTAGERPQPPPRTGRRRSRREQRQPSQSRFVVDLKFFWRAIQMLDLRRRLEADQPCPYWWTEVPDGDVPQAVRATMPIVRSLLPDRPLAPGQQQAAQALTPDTVSIMRRAQKQYPQYFVLEEYDADARQYNLSVWRERRNTVNLKDKWRNIGPRRYVKKKQAEGCTLSAGRNAVVCAADHGVNPNVHSTVWSTVKSDDGDTLYSGWARVSSKRELRFPTAAQGGFDVGNNRDGDKVHFEVDERKMQHFAVRTTVALMKAPTSLRNNALLRHVFSNHPMRPADETADQFIERLVREYRRTGRAWNQYSVKPDLHERRLWEQVSITLALLEWRDWNEVDAARNWTALLDMYQRSHRHPFYLVDANGVSLQKFCVVGAKEAAKKGRARHYSVARVQTPRSNLFKKYELHVYDMCSNTQPRYIQRGNRRVRLPPKDVELYSEKNIPVLEQYRRPALAVIESILGGVPGETAAERDIRRRKNGFGPLYDVSVTDPFAAALPQARALPLPDVEDVGIAEVPVVVVPQHRNPLAEAEEAVRRAHDAFNVAQRNIAGQQGTVYQGLNHPEFSDYQIDTAVVDLLLLEARNSMDAAIQALEARDADTATREAATVVELSTWASAEAVRLARDTVINLLNNPIENAQTAFDTATEPSRTDDSGMQAAARTLREQLGYAEQLLSAVQQPDVTVDQIAALIAAPTTGVLAVITAMNVQKRVVDAATLDEIGLGAGFGRGPEFGAFGFDDLDNIDFDQLLAGDDEQQLGFGL